MSKQSQKDSTSREIFGANMNFLMTVKMISDAALADKLGITRQTVHRYRIGAVLPRLDVAIQIADALGVDVKSMFHGMDDNTDPNRWHWSEHDPPKPLQWVIAMCQGGIYEILRHNPETGLWESPIPYRCYQKGYVIKWQEPEGQADAEEDR